MSREGHVHHGGRREAEMQRAGKVVLGRSSSSTLEGTARPHSLRAAAARA